MPPTRALLLYRELLGEHRDRLDRLIDRRGAARLKKMYEQAESDLLKKLALRAGPKGQAFTAHTQRLLLAQIRQGQALIARRMAGELGDLSREAQIESLRGLGRQVTKLEKAFTGVTTVLPIEEASVFQGVIAKRKTSLMRVHQTSMNRYGARLVGKMEGELSQSLMQGETVHEAIGRIEEATGNEWWQAERIVRTEGAMAYSSATADGIAAISDSVGGMWMRWTEFVDDSSGEGLDDRVAIDSEALHGQVAPPGGKFIQPPTSKVGGIVSAKLAGKEFDFPPNRPNDRATLAPWRPEWGVPGWQWIGGRRKPVTKIPDAGEFGEIAAQEDVAAQGESGERAVEHAARRVVQPQIMRRAPEPFTDDLATVRYSPGRGSRGYRIPEPPADFVHRDPGDRAVAKPSRRAIQSQKKPRMPAQVDDDLVTIKYAPSPPARGYKIPKKGG